MYFYPCAKQSYINLRQKRRIPPGYLRVTRTAAPLVKLSILTQDVTVTLVRWVSPSTEELKLQFTADFKGWYVT